MSKITDLPSSERPREKAYLLGVENLSNIELLAIIISYGVKNMSAIDIASHLICQIKGIENLKYLTLSELLKIKGISKVKALTILSVIEIIKRTNCQVNFIKVDINYLTNLFIGLYENVRQEKSYLVLLDKNDNLLFLNSIFSGSENTLAISSNLILSYILKYDAKKFYLIHNHPSGDSTPSDNDIITTNSIELLTLSVSCHLVDHLIFAKDNYFSIRKQCKFPLKKSECK